MSSINLSHLCLGCMNYLDNPKVPCPKCGYTRGTQNAVHQLAAGSRLITDGSEYMIGRVIGEGGFGITYLAWDVRNQGKVAIKEFYPADIAGRERNSHTIRPSTSNDVESYKYGLNRFMEEADKLRTFNHDPRIVSVKESFKANGTAYIVMEYIEGVTLRKKLDAGNRFGVEDTIKILAPTAGALVEMHNTVIHDENGKETVLIHRDISPDNIIFTTSGTTKLLDFGAARAASFQGTKNLTTTVKLGYAPPEQFIGSGIAGAQGPWTDVYALAATMYQMLTGVMPPPALDRQLADTLKSPSTYGVKMTEYQETALMKGLSLNWQERYQSVDEFYNAMQNIRPHFDNTWKSTLAIVMPCLGMIFNILIFFSLAYYVVQEEDEDLVSEMLSMIFTDAGFWLNWVVSLCALAYVWDMIRLVWKQEPPKWLTNLERRTQVIFVHTVSLICLMLVRTTEESDLAMAMIIWCVYGVLTIGGMLLGRQILNRVWR